MRSAPYIKGESYRKSKYLAARAGTEAEDDNKL